VVVPTDRLAVVPTGVTLQTAAALPLTGTTALNLVRGAAPLLGRDVLITGASGAVGGLAVQLAALAGAEVTALASAAHASRLASYGARQTIDDLAMLDARDRFDVVLESVGGTTLRDAFTRIAPRGLILTFGNSSGEPTDFDLLGFIGHEGARIQTYFSYAHEREARANLETVLDLVASGRLVVDTLAVRDWEHLNEAIAAMRARRATGKPVLTIGPSDGFRSVPRP
jgi:NADPH:quinone reductase-like Zn-dependent oxidoreductase